MRKKYHDNQEEKKNRKKDNKSQNREKMESEKEYDDIIFGRNAVLELLKSDKDINKIFVEKGEKHRFDS